MLHQKLNLLIRKKFIIALGSIVVLSACGQAGEMPSSSLPSSSSPSAAPSSFSERKDLSLGDIIAFETDGILSTALVLGSEFRDGIDVKRLLLSDGRVVWSETDLSVAIKLEAALYPRSADIYASKMPIYGRGDTPIEWQDWNLALDTSLEITDVSTARQTETPTFVSAKGRVFGSVENDKSAPFLWPQIQVKNGASKSWISLSDVIIRTKKPVQKSMYSGVIHRPFLSSALEALRPEWPAGKVEVENIALQTPKTQSVDLGKYTLQQILVAPVKSQISYVLCGDDEDNNTVCHVKWSDNTHRAFGFLSDGYSVPSPLLLGYEIGASIKGQASDIVLHFVQIGGDDESLMQVTLDGAGEFSGRNFIKNVDY